MKLRKRIFFILVSIFVILGLAACNNNADTVKIAFSQDDYTVKTGAPGVALDINITAGSNYNANTIRNQLVFSSSDESVAKFVDGKLTGVGIGETEIKVEWSEKAIVFDKAKVTVLLGELPGVIFGNYSPNMLKGSQQTISWEFDTVYTDASVRWESANPEIATVDQNGVISAVAVGEATIVCYSTNGKEEKAHVLKVNVSESDFAINYVLNGGVNSEENPAGYNTLNTPLTLANPTKLGYTFAGWFADEALTEAAGTIAEGSTGDVTVYAKWEIENYSIEYALDGGENAEANPESYTVEDEVVLAEATKTNHKFLGWFDAEGNKVEKVAKGSTGNLQLTARWELLAFNISYELDGGSFVLPYVYQSHAEMVADFVVDFNKHSGKTVKADGSDFFAISYNGSGESAGYKFLTSAEYGAKWAWMLKLINDDRVARGATPLSESDGQAEARGEIHTFLNLCDTSGTAKYGTDRSGVKFEDYAAKYLPKDPSIVEPVYQYVKGETTKLPVPVKAEHNFLGWIDESGNKLVEVTAETSGDLKLTATWEETRDEWDLAYELNGGTLSEGAPTTYLTSTGLDLSTITASKEDYSFVGWSLSEGGEIVTSIPQGTKDTVTLYANYKAAEYKIEYELNGGSFAIDSVEYIYSSFDALVEDFLADYSNKFALSGLTVANFYTKSSSYGLLNFFKDEALGAKWAWLQTYILGAQENYSGLNYMKNPSNASNYNKYWRANLSAFLQKTRLTSPMTMDFSGVDTEDWWKNYVPTKVVTVASDPKYSYTIEELPLALETPVREGMEFLGWSLDETYTNVFKELPVGTKGDIKLYAKWPDTVAKLPTHKIEYELNGGELPEGAATEYQETVGLANLPVPTKEGYKFLGWALVDGSAEYVTSISADSKEDVKLFAQWEEDKSGRPTNYLYVGVGEDYATIADALKDAKDGYVIVVAAGEYTLSSTTISKAVTIQGPNAGVRGDAERQPEALVKLDTVTVNSDVTIDGLSLNGGGYIGNTGIFGGAGLTQLVIKNSLIDAYQNIFVQGDAHTATDTIVTMENNKITKIGQFIVWIKNNAAAKGYKAVNFYNNLTVASAEYAGIDGLYNGMFSIRCTDNADLQFNVVGNFLAHMVSTTSGYFRLNSGNGTVKYNTFENITKFQSDSSTAPITYDGNLYLNADGAALTAAPEGVAAKGGVADVKVSANEEERAKGAEAWLKANNVEAEYAINYELNGGAFENVSYETTVTGEAVATIATTSSSNYWDPALYPTNTFLHKAGEANAMSSKPLYAHGITLKANEQGVLIVTGVEVSGKSMSYAGADYMITVAESGSTHAGVKGAGVVVGQAAVIEGDVATGVATVKFYDAANITSTEVKTPIEHPTTYKASELPLDLATPVLAGKEFYGWYLTSDFSDKRFFVLPEGTKGDVTLYARFVEPGWVEPTFGSLSFELNGGKVEGELPVQYEIGKELVLPTPTKLGYKFLGWSLVDGGADYFTTLPATVKDEQVKLYAQWELDAIFVGEGGDYATIQEAVDAANEGALIVVAPGTFAEDVKIEKNSLTLQGANAGIAWDGTRGEETIINSVTIKGSNIVVDGFKMTAIQAADVQKSNNVVLTNLVMGAAPTAINQQVVNLSGDIDGFSLLNSSIIETGIGSFTHYRAVHGGSAEAKNVVIRGNKFQQDAGTGVYIDGIKLANIAGDITIEDNDFCWPGANFTVFLGSTRVAYDTVVNFNRNRFSSPEGASGVAVRYTDETTIVNIIGNSFSNVYGNVVQVRANSASDRTTPTTTNISNNAFLDTSTKVSLSISLDKLTMENNYFFEDVVWSHADASSKNANPAADGAAALGGVKSHKVNFVVEGGFEYAELPTSFIEGVNMSLAAIKPTSAKGYRFVGWYDNAEFSGEKVTSLGSQTADVTLYAKFEAIPVYKVTYVLGGDDVEVSGLVASGYEGSVVQLPTPSRFGYTFLGWTTVEGGTDYITSVTLDADVTVYANWTDAEILEVTYVFNGGNLTYENLAAVKADFDVDYKALTGQSSYSIWNNSDKLGNVFRDSNHKWDWLLNYWAAVNPNSYGGQTNASVFIQMRDLGTCPDYYFFGVEITSWYTSTQKAVYSNTLKSADYANADIQDAWWKHYSEVAANTAKFVGTYTLPTTVYNSEREQFLGWYTTPDFSGEPVTEVSENITVYAKWAEATPVTSVTIDNKVEKLKVYETLQLQWTINPSEAPIQTVKFASSNPEVVAVSETGFLSALKEGKATITITSNSSSGASDSFEVEVYTPAYFDFSYETESYVEVDGSIQLNAVYHNLDKSLGELEWSSLNADIATVDAAGKVTGVNKGVATIRASLKGDATVYTDFVVTVLDADMSEALKEVVAAHESNAFVRYNLGIGSGTPVYYADVFGSVSKLFYNHPFVVDSTYLEAGNASKDYYENSNAETQYGGVQFVTVHYTAGMAPTADSDNHASYFTGGTSDTSIHYVTGNKGNDAAAAEVYKTLDHKHGAWHAGDSNSRYYSNSTNYQTVTQEDGSVVNYKRFQWIPTGVAYDGANLLNGITWSVSNDFYFELNGKKTSIKLPDTYDFKSRNSDHIYNADGTISSQPDFLSQFSWGSTFSNVPAENFLNKQGYALTVKDGEYYMGPTWWSYGQVVNGMICSVGGNQNSIGIESCVNEGSDLWYTWQVTAQLVANLMVEFDLTIDRVKGHHYFDGKDCPQPLLENDMEIWKEFIELVQHEHAAITTFKDSTFEFKANGEYDFVGSTGRVFEQPEWSTIVSYTVTVKTGDVTETITLATAVEGIYNK